MLPYKNIWLVHFSLATTTTATRSAAFETVYDMNEICTSFAHNATTNQSPSVGLFGFPAYQGLDGVRRSSPQTFNKFLDRSPLKCESPPKYDPKQPLEFNPLVTSMGLSSQPIWQPCDSLERHVSEGEWRSFTLNSL